MAALTTAILVGAAVVGTAATAASYNQQRKSAKAQSRAIKAQQRQADIQNARERRNAVRNARVARASIESQAAMTGVGVSSTVAGSLSNVQQQMGSNVSFLDQMVALSEEASVANQQAANYASKAQGWSDLGNVVNKMGATYGG